MTTFNLQPLDEEFCEIPTAELTYTDTHGFEQTLFLTIKDLYTLSDLLTSTINQLEEAEEFNNQCQRSS